jgi:MFS family permease
MVGDNADNPFASFAPQPTELVRRKVARQSSVARRWRRCFTGAGVAGFAVGAALILLLGGVAGAALALQRVVLAVGISLGVTLGGMAVVGAYAIRYWAHLRTAELDPRPRLVTFAVLLGAAAALGATGGVFWFSAELPDPNGWILVCGTGLAILLGGGLGAWTAPADREPDART